MRIGFALAIAAVVLSSGSGASQAATSTLPCGSSLDAAYDAAQPGDVIELQACSYSGKALTGTKASPGVTFDLNGSDQGSVDVRATWVEFRDGTLDWQWPSGGVYSGGRFVTFRNIVATGIYIDGGQDVSVIGGEIGPHASDQMNWIFNARNIVLDGVYVHDNRCTSSGCHYEAIRIDRNVDGVMIRNSVFRRNAIFHIFITSGSTTYPKNVTIEHNCFDQPNYGYSVVAIHDPVLTSLDPATLHYSVINNFAETGSNFRGPFEVYSGNTFGPESTCDSWIGNPPPPPPPPPPAVCADGIDNDGDGLIDYPADPGCADAQDGDEYNAPPPPPPTCAAPTLTGGVQTDTTSTVTWSAVPGVTGYVFYKNGSKVSSAGPAATSVKFGKLSYGSTVLGVAAVCPDGEKLAGATTIETRVLTS